MEVNEKMLSVIIPAYNEIQNIQNTGNVIADILDEAGIECELIFVDDGSRDGTFEEIKKLHEKRQEIKGIKFSRNFGKEAAIQAGLRQAKGACSAVIDCDLQHPPEVLVEMYHLWEQGYDIIEGVKSSRGKENFLYKGCSKFFYGLISKAIGFDMSTSSDFKLISREVSDIISSLPERNLFFRALSYWVGFSSAKVEYEVHERVSGTTKWSPVSLVKYAVHNIVSFTTAPLQIITGLGIVLLVLSVIVGIDSIVSYILGRAVGGYPTMIILLLLIGGSIMMSLGIIGLYIGEIYREVKKRPVYLVQDVVS